MLLVNELTKRYRQVTALAEVSCEFDTGVHGLLAPNGAGKTTLIKALTTLLRPTSGEVLYDGVDVWALGEDYRDLLGYLPQDFGYYRNYSARSFLHYLAALKGLDRRANPDRVGELLELVGLADVADRKLRTFSGGMVQRVGIAQAMLNDPRILILDEPTAGLDPKERVRFRNLISALSAERTVILSTHIVSDIESIANVVVMLDRGRLITRDTPAGILAGYTGRVFETSDAAAIRPGDLRLTERHEGDQVRYRFLPLATVSADAVEVTPNLEDVFLATYQDEA